MTDTGVRSSRRRLLVAAVAAVVVAVAGVWLVGRWRNPVASVDDVRPTAEQFLAQLRTGRPDQLDAAWSATTAEFKSDMGRDRFRRFVLSTPPLRGPSELTDFRMTDANGLRRAECDFHTPSGMTLRVLLAYEGSAWKVERILAEPVSAGGQKGKG